RCLGTERPCFPTADYPPPTENTPRRPPTANQQRQISCLCRAWFWLSRIGCPLAPPWLLVVLLSRILMVVAPTPAVAHQPTAQGSQSVQHPRHCQMIVSFHCGHASIRVWTSLACP